MPELPEVENYRALAGKALGRRVRGSLLKRPGLLSGLSPKALAAALRGRRFTETARIGKNLFLRLDRGARLPDGQGWLSMHFGLSGWLKFEAKEESARKTGTLVVSFEDGSALAYSALFGAVGLVKDPREFARKKKLGPDALAVDRRTFERIMRAKKRDVKTVLMDQSSLAGVGNLYSDEALFRARIHPCARVEDLDAKKLGRLHAELVKVLKEMVVWRKKGEWVFPPKYLAPLRETGGRCPRCRGRLASRPHGGRKTVFCPRCQTLPR